MLNGKARQDFYKFLKEENYGFLVEGNLIIYVGGNSRVNWNDLHEVFRDALLILFCEHAGIYIDVKGLQKQGDMLKLRIRLINRHINK